MSPSPRPWLLLQLADGAFPSGGFAHSGGLEATVQLRGVDDVETFLREALWQAGRSSLPFVAAAAAAPTALAALDRADEVILPSHVANAASRAQGRALLGAARRAFEDAGALRAVAAAARSGPSHHAPVFGAVFGALGTSVDEARVAYLFGVARSTLSAGVRLGIVGPLEAQGILAAHAPELDRIVEECGDLALEDAAQAAPLLELFGALHDRLDARLFQS